MKTFTLLLFVLASINNWAQNAAIKINYEDSTLITVQLDGVSYSDPAPIIFINGLQAGEHQLKVFKLMKMGSSQVNQSVYDGFITLQTNMTKIFVINRYNQLRDVGSEAINNTSENTESRDNPQGRFVPDPAKINSGTSAYTSGQGMSNNQWQQQLEMLRLNNSESSRNTSAKQLLSLYTINSNQLAELMLLFQNEQNRINLASFGFDYIVDKQNFGVVYNALRSPRSINRLDRRLRGRI